MATTSAAHCMTVPAGPFLKKTLRLVVEEAKPEPEKPPVEPTKPKPAKPPKPWFTIDESDIEALLGISFDIKPASEMWAKPSYDVAASGNWTAPKPEPTASDPKPKKEEKTVTSKCCKCAAYQQIADCAYGFCSAWHNFAGKDELCSRFRAVDTVDKEGGRDGT